MTLRSIKKWTIAGLMSLLASTNAAASGAELITPQPIPIPSGKTLKEVATAISLGATERGWVVKEIAPGVMEARIDVRNKHTLIVDIKYDAKQIALAYKSSVNLNSEVVDGRPYIHQKANSWMKNLTGDINKFLSR